jgi:hypothetical protein
LRWYKISEDNIGRHVPINNIDAEFLTTDTAWGKMSDIPRPLLEYLKDQGDGKLVEGKVEITEQQLWIFFGYYTRDLRLGNLKDMFGEVETAKYYLDLAGDCLRMGYKRAFITALSRVATIIEISQSRNGFFRNLLKTFRTEKFEQYSEPKKVGLFGQRSGGERQ